MICGKSVMRSRTWYFQILWVDDLKLLFMMFSFLQDYFIISLSNFEAFLSKVHNFGCLWVNRNCSSQGLSGSLVTVSTRVMT